MKSRLSASDFKRARQRLLQMHYDSGVGHIGGNLSAIDAMMVTFHEFMRPSDRFILSKGHAAGALYTVLWTLDQLTDDDLKTFHRDDTLLPGHPPVRGLPQVDFATGSLGHGLSLASGTALAFRLKGTSGRVFCLMSDGEWQEGSTWEALIFACHHRLSNLTVLVDHNGLQGFGGTAEIASMNPLADRLVGFDAEIVTIPGHDPEALCRVLQTPSDQLRIIVLQTIKGSGVSFMENEMEWHYRPLTEAQYHQALQELEAA